MIRLCLLALLGMGSAAAAETVAIRSGEHADFTRLVLEFDHTPVWTLREEAGRWHVDFPLTEVEFDGSSIFQRIPRTRLRDVAMTGDGLRLDLGCACRSRVFVVRDTALVIDILDERAGDGLQPVRSFPRAPGRARQASLIELPRAVMIDPGTTRLLSGSAAGEVLPVRSGAIRELSIPGLDRRAEIQTRFPQLNEIFRREIERAAAQGLISADVQPSAQPAASHPPDRPVLPANVQIQTAVDRDLLGVLREGLASPSQCWPPARTNVARWGEEQAGLDELARLRAELLGEFDRPDPRTLRDLVRHLIYLSFGAEARQASSVFAPNDPDADLLVALSFLVEGEAPPTDVMLSQSGCSGPGGLWAAVAAPYLHGDFAPNRSSVILSFGDLPRHLRRVIGPGLAEKFARAGDDAAAAAIRNASERGGLPTADALALLDARLARERGGDPKTADLARIAVSGSSLSAEALILLTELSRTGTAALPRDIPETAAALQAEHTGTALYSRLVEAEIDAWLMAGETLRAIDRLEDARAILAPEVFGRLSDASLAWLADSAPDADFVTEMFRDQVEFLFASASGAQDAALLRLRRLGFEQRAEDLFQRHGPARSRPAPAPATFGDYLADTDDAELLAELGRRASAAGQHSVARAFYGRADQDEAAALAAWREGLLDEAARPGGTAWRDALAGLGDAEPQPSTGVPDSLELTRDLVGVSEALRADLGRVFSAFPAVPEE